MEVKPLPAARIDSRAHLNTLLIHAILRGSAIYDKVGSSNLCGNGYLYYYLSFSPSLNYPLYHSSLYGLIARSIGSEDEDGRCYYYN